MGTHYNAFISYKHADLDNKVAAAIEKDLEHYHIPKKLQKKTGYKKIERIFRDTDELPITSDLSGTIEEALKNSEYLIVLCSTNTHLSTWVEREIAIFLQNHTQDQIFTVVADGEPGDVIPGVLQQREVKRINEAGVEETFIEKVEPLACDYRLSRREVKNTEVPRLVAALIGCSYNELMDRQRQYKMKRLTAVATGVMTLSVGFGAYMLYSNYRIQENYLNALRNQSQYLAKESTTLLDNEQRIPALSLALAALPDEKTPERPVIPEAVSALTESSMAYVPLVNSNIVSNWSYTMPDTIKDFYVDSDGSTLAAIDTRHNVSVWVKDTHEETFNSISKELYERIEDIAYVAPNRLLVEGIYYLTCIDTTTGKEVWSTDKLSDEVLGGLILVLDDDYFLVSDYKKNIYKISSKDGTVADTFSVYADKFSDEALSLVSASVSPSKDKIAFLSQLGEERHTHLCILDLNDKSVKSVDVCGEDTFTNSDTFYNTFWVGNDHVCCDATVNDDAAINQGFLNMYTYAPNHMNLYCVNVNDMSFAWTNVFEYSTFFVKSGFAAVPYCDGVAYFAGNICNVMSLETGEILYSNNFNEPIVWMACADGLPSCITRGGGFTSVDEAKGNNVSTAMYYFTDDVNEATINHGAYICQKASNEIIYYQSGVYDDNFEMFENAPADKVFYHDYIADEIIASLIKDDGVVLRLYDPVNKTFLQDVELNEDENNYYSYEILGSDDKNIYLTSYIDKTQSAIKVAYDTGTVSENVILTNEGYSKPLYSYSDDKLAIYNLNNGAVVYIYDFDKEDIACEYSFEEAKKTTDRQGEIHTFMTIRYNADAGIVYLGGDVDIVIDLNKEEAMGVTMPSDWNMTMGIVINNDFKRIITSDDTHIMLRDFEGNFIAGIDNMETAFFNPYIYSYDGTEENAMLLVACDDGKLYRYALQDMSYIGESTIAGVNVYGGDKDKALWHADFDNNLLYLTEGGTLAIVDTTKWIMITDIPYCIGYHVPTDSYIVFSADENRDKHLGYYKRYTLKELIKRGNDMLKGIEISEDFKALYGIG